MDVDKFRVITDQLMETGLRPSVKKFASNANTNHDDDSYQLLCRDRQAACSDCAQVVTNRLVLYEAVLTRSKSRIWRKKCVNCRECWQDTGPNTQE